MPFKINDYVGIVYITVFYYKEHVHRMSRNKIFHAGLLEYFGSL